MTTKNTQSTPAQKAIYTTPVLKKRGSIGKITLKTGSAGDGVLLRPV